VEWELWPRDLAIPVLGCNQMNIQTWSSLLKVNFIRSLFQWIFYSTLWLRPPCVFNVWWYLKWLCANIILALQDFTAAIRIQWETRIRRIIARRNYFLAMTVTVASRSTPCCLHTISLSTHQQSSLSAFTIFHVAHLYLVLQVMHCCVIPLRQTFDSFARLRAFLGLETKTSVPNWIACINLLTQNAKSLSWWVPLPGHLPTVLDKKIAHKTTCWWELLYRNITTSVFSEGITFSRNCCTEH
jgi:hypothetical protein